MTENLQPSPIGGSPAGLKACPFCGSDHLFASKRSGIICRGCRVVVYSGLAGASDSFVWNCRATPDGYAEERLLRAVEALQQIATLGPTGEAKGTIKDAAYRLGDYVHAGAKAVEIARQALLELEAAPASPAIGRSSRLEESDLTSEGLGSSSRTNRGGTASPKSESGEGH